MTIIHIIIDVNENFPLENDGRLKLAINMHRNRFF